MTFAQDPRYPVSSPCQSMYGATPIRPDAEPVWSLQTSGKEFDNLVVFHGRLVIVHRGYTEIVAVDRETGEVAWQRDDPLVAGTPRSKQPFMKTPSAFRCGGGVLFLRGENRPVDASERDGSRESQFVRLDAQTGEVIDGPGWQRDPTLSPETDVKLLGDWSYHWRTGAWVHLGSGEVCGATPASLSHLDSLPFGRVGARGLYAQEFWVGHRVGWLDKPDAYGRRVMGCIELSTGRVLWERGIQARLEDIPQKSVLGTIRTTRGQVVLSEGRGGRSVAGNFVVLSMLDGSELWRGRCSWSSAPEVWTGRLFAPPDDARDLLVLTCMREGRYAVPGPNEVAGESAEQEGHTDVLCGFHPATGEVVWSAEQSLGSRYLPSSGGGVLWPGAYVLARSANTLWVKSIAYNTTSMKKGKPGTVREGQTYPVPKESCVLAAVDHNTGAVLYTRKLPRTAEYAGQDAGRLYLREGRKLVCYA